MTIKHAAAAFEAPTTGPTQRLCLLELAYHADRRGIIRLSQTEIAAITGLNRRTVVACFRQLEEASLLEQVGHGRYRLNDASLSEEDVAEQATIPRSVPTAAERKRIESANEELARIRAIKRPNQGIVYTRDGWPTLTDL